MSNMKQFFEDKFKLLMDEIRSTKEQSHQTSSRETGVNSRNGVDHATPSMNDNVFFSRVHNQSNIDFMEKTHKKDQDTVLGNTGDVGPLKTTQTNLSMKRL